ncbi:MAG: hypothetical protein LBV60_18615 [Streptomyces sp.]|nr:hypothetical protein [Streptomyces sp.]
MPWDRAGEFVVGDVVRPASLRRKALRGPRAVRVPTTDAGVRYFAPSVLVHGSEDETPSYDLYDATAPAVLLCSLAPEKGGARYRVTDAQGTELGLAHRTPAAKRTVQHSWWLQQPGHPDIVARYHWARGNAKQAAKRGKESVGRVAGHVAQDVIGSVFSFGAEDTGPGESDVSKPVTWRMAGQENSVVLTSGHAEGFRTYLPQVSWLDRRLAFALAVLREA